MKKSIVRQFLIALAAVAGCVIISGCATPDQESDMPWNTPQSWENQSPMGSMFSGS